MGKKRQRVQISVKSVRKDVAAKNPNPYVWYNPNQTKPQCSEGSFLSLIATSHSKFKKKGSM